MQDHQVQPEGRNAFIFIAVVIAVPWLGRSLDILLENQSTRPGLLIWIATPLVASLGLRAFGGSGWQDLGLRPHLRGNGRWYALSLLIYPVSALMIVLTGLIIGAVLIPDLSPAKIGAVGTAAGAALGPQFVINLLEESGFRGFLAPKLNALKVNSWAAHVIVGLIWGAWHLPYFSFVTSYSSENFDTLVPRFLVGTIVASVVYGEIRLLTDSVWPAVLMQTAGGAFLTGLLAERFLLVTPELEFLFLPVVEGVLTALVFLIVGVGLYRARVKKYAGSG
ncbi:MAG: CPBP family intramembrane metalloprotease [Ardenticatenaceae bacterium]|nr:CPBP family intramembrane metalloprotease [Ardenticatenaceae bacterium]